MQDIDIILDFSIGLGKEMLLSGANIERVTLTIEYLCQKYRLTNVSVQTLTTSITVSARNSEGVYAGRIVSVPPAHIRLERLRRLNNLARYVRKQDIQPEDLAALLKEVKVKSYPMPIVLSGYLLAMASLCLIFGGVWQDVVVALVNTVILFFLTSVLTKARLNRIIANVLSMFLCGSLAFAFVYLGFAKSFYVVIITNAFFLIPGIPMINSVRNILCGYEMNGILELLKVILEVITIVAGLWLAFLCFGNGYDEAFGDSMLEGVNILSDVELVILSFFASLGFAVVFEIKPSYLPFAGLGGALVRIVYLLLIRLALIRIAFTALAAFSAALYAEILAFAKKTPATVFLYPSIIPLIPGDLFYYAMVGLIMNKADLFTANATECVLALVGISVGFVVSSSFVHYIRRIRFRKIKRLLRRQPQAKAQ
ncbi:MAG: threonine/serine exporter ThrE family protein [Christensenellaceae bacterium]